MDKIREYIEKTGIDVTIKNIEETKTGYRVCLVDKQGYRIIVIINHEFFKMCKTDIDRIRYFQNLLKDQGYCS